MNTKVENEVSGMTKEAIQFEIARHKQAALHHEEAAAKHLAAAAKYAAGDLEKASELALQAHHHEVLQPVYDPADRKQHAAM